MTFFHDHFYRVYKCDLGDGQVGSLWRREGDSNPRSRANGITVFKTVAIDHSAISPLFLL
jgi:hypothetical protein